MGITHEAYLSHRRFGALQAMLQLNLNGRGIAESSSLQPIIRVEMRLPKFMHGATCRDQLHPTILGTPQNNYHAAIERPFISADGWTATANIFGLYDLAFSSSIYQPCECEGCMTTSTMIRVDDGSCGSSGTLVTPDKATNHLA